MYRKLEGWQGKFLFLSGRITLINSALSATTLYIFFLINIQSAHVGNKKKWTEYGEPSSELDHEITGMRKIC